MPPKGPKMVPAKGSWQTPTQRMDALVKEWAKLERLGLNFEGITIDKDRVEKPIEKNVADIDDTSAYDNRFHFSLDFNPKSKRDDRQDPAAIRDRIHHEEKRRSEPLTTSQLYGRVDKKLDETPMNLHRRMRTMDEIYRRFRINVKPEKKLPVKFEPI